MKRPPSGIDKEHPLLDNLRRKDFIAVTQLSQDEVTEKDFSKSFLATCERGAPFMSFMCKALELPF